MAEQRQVKHSYAEKKKILFKKYKGYLKSYYETSDFKEPILILLRRNQRAEFFENATSGEFKFTDSLGNERRIILSPQYLQNFDYGKKSFKGYVCYEDAPTPLPEQPYITAELVNIALDKALNDIKKWKAEELKAMGKLWWYILGGIALVILAYALFKMLVPAPTPIPIASTVQEAVNNTAQVVI